jgi:outer membrane protein assembly factor BamB
MTSKAETGGWLVSRRTALGGALAAAAAMALPLTAGGPMRHAAAKPAAASWMHAGNAARTGAFPGSGLDLEKELTELWRINASQAGNLIISYGVCDGIVYYREIPGGPGSSVVYPIIAVEAKSGNELWRYDPPVTDPPTFFAGQPAIVDGLLVVMTYSGLLAGIDAKTGKERWVFDLGGTTTYAARPAIVDGVVYVSDNTSVNAVKLGDTPEWVWKAALTDGTTTVVSPTVSVDGDYVVVSATSPDPGSEIDQNVTDIHVLKVADGDEAYRFRYQDVGTSVQFAVQNEVLYSRNDNDSLQRSYFFAMSIGGTGIWNSRTTTDVLAYPVVDDKLVYGTAGEGVWAYDAATGQPVWKSPSLEHLDSELVLIDGVIYVGVTEPAQLGLIYALSAKDGSLLKSIPVPFNGTEVAGITNGVLIARTQANLVAFHTLGS